MNSGATNMPRSSLRTLVETCVWLLLAAIATETWFVAGLAVPCRIVGDSMAETLLGAHREVLCADCGCRFVCGIDPRSAKTWAACPNCGCADNDMQTLPGLKGNRILIDRSAFSFRGPRRWEVVALRNPQRTNELIVKRVVGLPGESIAIRAGNVYANGQIQRKDLAQQRAMAILVHDADVRPASDSVANSHWKPAQAGSLWRSERTGFSHLRDSKSEPTDWLVYHHQREEPVTDRCSYNQSQPQLVEDIHTTADLLLRFLLEPASDGEFFVRATDGADTFEVRLRIAAEGRAAWQYEAFFNDIQIPDAKGSVKPASRRLVEVSLIDEQFLLALDGETVLAWPYERRLTSSPTPFAIGARGLGATIRAVRVLRDVYYTPPLRTGANRPAAKNVHLGADEYFVLGDNSPISEDSRDWPRGGAVPAGLLIGKPFLAIPSLVVTPWQGWHFQVPNLRRIRYIQ
jgi:signal peptidase I